MNGRLVALIDVEDMIVIDTEEILLVAKSKSQDVKKWLKLKRIKENVFLKRLEYITMIYNNKSASWIL